MTSVECVYDHDFYEGKQKRKEEEEKEKSTTPSGIQTRKLLVTRRALYHCATSAAEKMRYWTCHIATKY